MILYYMVIYIIWYILFIILVMFHQLFTSCPVLFEPPVQRRWFRRHIRRMSQSQFSSSNSILSFEVANSSFWPRFCVQLWFFKMIFWFSWPVLLHEKKGATNISPCVRMLQRGDQMAKSHAMGDMTQETWHDGYTKHNGDWCRWLQMSTCLYWYLYSYIIIPHNSKFLVDVEQPCFENDWNISGCPAVEPWMHIQW